MSGIWHGCDGKRGSFYAPQAKQGKHCGKTFLLHGKPCECMGTITDIDGQPVCGECLARKSKKVNPSQT